MTAALLFVSLVLAQEYAPLRQGQDPLPPEQEARVQRVGKKLRCAVCQGVAITDSPASMARAQLDKVRELVREGKSDDEINDYFVERYGEWVLLEPRAGGLNLFLWAGPGLLLVGGLIFIWMLSRARPPPGVQAAQRAEEAAARAAAIAAASGSPPGAAPARGGAAAATTDDDLLARVRADLEK